MEYINQERIQVVAYNLLVNSAIRYPITFLEKLLTAFKNERDAWGKNVIATIIRNILLATEESACLCQDTGIPTFHIYLNPDISVKGDIYAAIAEATIKATDQIPIRKNVIEPFSFANTWNNIGYGTPFVYFYYNSNVGPMRIRAELKGFGGEIKSTADWIFTSTENMENALLAYVLNNVILSKGEGCIPGFLGIGIGGYISEAMHNAKNAVFRELNKKLSYSSKDLTTNRIAYIEQRLLRCVNHLGLGPMGEGGDTTTLEVYLERRGTHTAVAPVAVSQQCWASRASEALITENKVKYITPCLKKEDIKKIRQNISKELITSNLKGNVYKLKTPLNIEDILKLRIGDIVYLSGKICTSRDGAHRRMVEKIKMKQIKDIPKEITQNKVIYYSGPVVKKEMGKWCVNAAGPTTSSRFTNDAALLIDQGIFKVVIGKGMMGGKMIKAMKGKGVYLKAVGGCAVIYKNMINQAKAHWLDLGYPEAVWVLDVINFGPLRVGIDSQGNSLLEETMDEVYKNARKIYQNEAMDPSKRYIQYPQTIAGLSLEEVIAKGQYN